MFVDDQTQKNLIELYLKAREDYRLNNTVVNWIKLYEIKRMCINAGIPT